MTRRQLSEARKVLGISQSAEIDEVRKKYMGLAKKWHPDLNASKEAHEKMQAINNAYELIMKEVFDVADPWKEYQDWWWMQFGDDPLWGIHPEGLNRTRKYPGVRGRDKEIGFSGNLKNGLVDEFLDKKNVFAVVGVSKNPKKYGNKVYRELKSAGYEVYPVNPNVDYIDTDKCFSSLGDLPKRPDVIDIVVPPKITEKVVREATNLGIKKVWLQPGSESKETIDYCKQHKIAVLHDMCIMIRRRKSLRKRR